MRRQIGRTILVFAVLGLNAWANHGSSEYSEPPSAAVETAIPNDVMKAFSFNSANYDKFDQLLDDTDGIARKTIFAQKLHDPESFRQFITNSPNLTSSEPAARDAFWLSVFDLSYEEYLDQLQFWNHTSPDLRKALTKTEFDKVKANLKGMRWAALVSFGKSVEDRRKVEGKADVNGLTLTELFHELRDRGTGIKLTIQEAVDLAVLWHLNRSHVPQSEMKMAWANTEKVLKENLRIADPPKSPNALPRAKAPGLVASLSSHAPNAVAAPTVAKAAHASAPVVAVTPAAPAKVAPPVKPAAAPKAKAKAVAPNVVAAKPATKRKQDTPPPTNLIPPSGLKQEPPKAKKPPKDTPPVPGKNLPHAAAPQQKPKFINLCNCGTEMSDWKKLWNGFQWGEERQEICVIRRGQQYIWHTRAYSTHDPMGKYTRDKESQCQADCAAYVQPGQPGNAQCIRTQR